jgi:hypothetical protein
MLIAKEKSMKYRKIKNYDNTIPIYEWTIDEPEEPEKCNIL